MDDKKFSKSFVFEDQQLFAELSGDSNPMHMDLVVARRTQAGRLAVHGIHTLLWALDCIAQGYPELPPPHNLRVDFTSFLPVGATATLGALTGDAHRRATVHADGVAVMTFELRHAQPGPRVSPPPPVVDAADAAAPPSPIVLDLSEMAVQRGAVAFAGGAEAAARCFPHAAAWLGPARLVSLMGCTRLVGMVCPGLHSIFNRLDVTLTETARAADRLDYTVTQVDDRFRRVRLAVSGPGIQGSLTASVRHPPVRQADLALIAPQVDPDLFRGAVALVVGGSRGLGELTAKILAAGGAEVIVTYLRGRDDAERVADEIRTWGGRCSVVAYDAQDDAAGQLGDAVGRASSCYYYATTPIFGPSGRVFDKAKFERFFDIYVAAFHGLCEALMNDASRTVGVFFPSSVAVAGRPAGLGEYAMAKAAGEILCEEINQRQNRVRVLVDRLPRLATDQTTSLLSEETIPAIDVILPIVKQVESFRSRVEG